MMLHAVVLNVFAASEPFPIFSNQNFPESIIEIRATVWDGDMVIDHPYMQFLCPEVPY
jgi:hypothetical protein